MEKRLPWIEREELARPISQMRGEGLVKSNWKAWLAAVAAIVILLALARILMNHGGQAAGPAAPKAVVAQTVVRVKKQPALDLTGSIEAVQEAVVSAKVAGRVASVPVENGDAVASGQPLVLLEDSDYRNALAASQADLAKAQASLESDRDNYERQESLYDAGALSASDFEGVKTSLALAQADADSAATAVDSAQEALQETSICSPISGVAANLDVEIGEFLTPGAPPATSLLNVEDISSVYAVVNVEQGELAAVKSGLAAMVTTDAYGDRVFNGTVEIINPVAGSATRVFETKIRVANGDQLLRPGMFVNVSIRGARRCGGGAPECRGQHGRPELCARGRGQPGEAPAGAGWPGDRPVGGDHVWSGGGAAGRPDRYRHPE